MTKIVVILKTHGQISKKQCFEKYCSCEKLCQFSLRKKCPYSELFWSVFCRIRTEQGKILRISSHSVRMQKIQDRVTPNTDTFHAVFLLYMEYPIGVNWNFLFQILHITRLFPSPSPPFYIWSSLTSHQIQWDIGIPFFCFENSKRSSYYWNTKEMPHGKKVLCDIHTLEMLKTVKSYFH